MESVAVRDWIPFSRFELIRQGREIVRAAAVALEQVAGRLDEKFCDAVELLANCQGTIHTTGIGKAGIIARKQASTLASLSFRSQYLHPSEALHGDLGNVRNGDVLVALSNSGESEEIITLLRILANEQIPCIGITGRADGTLAQEATFTLCYGRLGEAGVLGLAPTTTTTAMLAICDALSIVASQRRGIGSTDFARNHPGGNLGKLLQSIPNVMRTGNQLRIAQESETIRAILASIRQTGRRTGAIILVNEQGELTGLFTDSDLVRLLENRRDEQLDRPIAEVMVRAPITVQEDEPLAHAVSILSEKRISELPVVDDRGFPVGLIDITDVIGLIPSPV